MTTASPQEIARKLGSGLLSFPVTHLREDGSFDEPAYRENIGWLGQFDASGLFAAGGTGEFFSLTPAEVEQVVTAAVQEAPDGVPVIAPAGYGTAIAVEMARSAERAGAHGILLLPPYLTETSQEGLVAHVRQVCAATELGVTIYSRANAAYSETAVAELVDSCPTLVGFKDGIGNIEQMTRIYARIGDRLTYIGGPAHRRDVRSAVSGAGRDHVLVGDLQLRAAVRFGLLRGAAPRRHPVRDRRTQRVRDPVLQPAQPQARLRGEHHQGRHEGHRPPRRPGALPAHRPRRRRSRRARHPGEEGEPSMSEAHTVEPTGASLIGADDVPGGTAPFQAVDPATGERLEPVYHEADEATVARAAQLAWEAFLRYRHTGFEQRAAFLETIADELENLGSVLVDRVNAETGIPVPRVQGELARTTGQLRLFANVVREGSWTGARLDTADPDRSPLPKPDLRQRKIPLGPVAVFSASNFPLAFSVAGGDTASALAAGAPVIVKAHSAHPGSSELVGRAIRKAVQAHDLPEGTFSLLFGSGRTTGIALVTDPHIRAVGFTGSRQAGVALTAAAAARPVPIPVYAEMSSINPVFVLPGALADRGEKLGAGFIASMMTGVGQLCTSPGLVFVVDGPGAPEFVQAAADAVRAAEPGAMLSSGIASSFAEGADRLSAKDSIGMVAVADDDASIAYRGVPQLFVTTDEEFLADHRLQEEVFGPASLIVRVDDVARLATIVDRLEGQLTATVHAAPSDNADARPLVDKLELIAGRVLFNGWPTGVEVGHAVVHGGPFPATSAPSTTSVGSLAIERFLRPVAYQNVPEELLADEVRTDNPLRIWRRVDGALQQT